MFCKKITFLIDFYTGLFIIPSTCTFLLSGLSCTRFISYFLHTRSCQLPSVLLWPPTDVCFAWLDTWHRLPLHVNRETTAHILWLLFALLFWSLFYWSSALSSSSLSFADSAHSDMKNLILQTEHFFCGIHRNSRKDLKNFSPVGKGISVAHWTIPAASPLTETEMFHWLV